METMGPVWGQPTEAVNPAGRSDEGILAATNALEIHLNQLADAIKELKAVLTPISEPREEPIPDEWSPPLASGDSSQSELAFRLWRSCGFVSALNVDLRLMIAQLDL